MKAIIQLYWQICRMRIGPEQVPTATTLTIFTFLAYAAMSFMARLSVGPIEYSAVALFAICGLWAVLVYGVLAFKGLTSRFQQTFTAALGTDVVLSCLMLPLSIAGSKLPETSPIINLAAILMLVIFIWDVLVKGFIFHRAFNVSPLLGNLYSLGLTFLFLRLDQSLLIYFVPEILEQVQTNQ